MVLFHGPIFLLLAQELALRWVLIKYFFIISLVAPHSPFFLLLVTHALGLFCSFGMTLVLVNVRAVLSVEHEQLLRVLRSNLGLGHSLLLVTLLFILHIYVLDNVILLVLRQKSNSVRVFVSMIYFILQPLSVPQSVDCVVR